MKVLVAESDAIARIGMESLLHMTGHRPTVVGNYTDWSKMMAGHQWDATILDPAQPDLNGWQALEEVPYGERIVLTEDAPTARKALHSHIRTVVAKHSDATDIAFALRQVERGRGYISPEFALSMVVEEKPKPAQEAPRPLSRRMFDVLNGIAHGKSNKAMARDMNISVKTVEYHRAMMMDQLGLHNVALLTAYYYRWYQ